MDMQPNKDHLVDSKVLCELITRLGGWAESFLNLAAKKRVLLVSKFAGPWRLNQGTAPINKITLIAGA